MVNLEKRAITEHFSNITDKRRYNKRHKLIDIIIITIVSVIAGANTWEQIEEYAVTRLSSFLSFDNSYAIQYSSKLCFIYQRWRCLQSPQLPSNHMFIRLS